MNKETESKRSATQVEEEISELTRSASRLDSVVDEFLSKISSVLRRDCPNPPGLEVSKDETELVELATKLRTICNHIDVITNKIANADDRLEL